MAQSDLTDYLKKKKMKKRDTMGELVRKQKLKIYDTHRLCKLPSLDPRCMEMFCYLRLYEVTHKKINFTCDGVDRGDFSRIPEFSAQGNTSYTTEEVATSQFCIEKRRGVATRQEVLLIEKTLVDIEQMCFHGLQTLQPLEAIWRSRIDHMFSKDEYIERMADSFEYLSNTLADNPFKAKTLS